MAGLAIERTVGRRTDYSPTVLYYTNWVIEWIVSDWIEIIPYVENE